MQTFYLNIALAFLEGIGLITSPCILPILPIVLSGTIEGGKARPFGIIFGFAFTFALFTIFARSIVQATGLDLNWIRALAFGLIAIFGLILVSDRLSTKFEYFTQQLANFGTTHSENPHLASKSGLIGCLILGALISLIWVPCAGPILAAAIVQTAIQKTIWQSFVVFLSFALGSVLPMVLIALFGKKILFGLSSFKQHAGLYRKIFGLIIFCGALLAALYAFYDLSITSNKEHGVTTNSEFKLIDGLSQPYLAPEFKGEHTWINSNPLTIEQLHGKVVLIDFWTYSCINCVRTLSYLTNWYNKYHQYGFEIIGVHAPEFEFEKNLNNVKQAVIKHHILYPVMLDNNFSTWLSYHNHYWPAHYLIDKNGKVVYQHFGEGKYQETEDNIKFLLNLNNSSTTHASNHTKTNTSYYSKIAQTPETYLGYDRLENFASPEKIIYNEVVNFTFPNHLHKNQWALQGKWKIEGQRIIAMEIGAKIKLNFYAQQVFAVMASNDHQSKIVQIKLNDKDDHIINISNATLYTIINLPQANSSIVELQCNSPGVELYTFTFG